MAKPRRIKASDVEVSFLKGSGPGGQHRNKRFTGVRMKHLPTGLVSLATERRTRSVNMKLAMERLEAKFEKLSYRPPSRRQSAPPESSRRNRLETKKKRSSVKEMRRIRRSDWD